MGRYRCTYCEFVYDDLPQRGSEDDKKVPFSDLPEEWRCPVCFMPKREYKIVERERSSLKK